MKVVVLAFEHFNLLFRDGFETSRRAIVEGEECMIAFALSRAEGVTRKRKLFPWRIGKGGGEARTPSILVPKRE